ncbi:MAG: hypothetical protein WC679_00100 [Bacteroidales bacterium]|jgi:hypothetical protein
MKPVTEITTTELANILTKITASTVVNITYLVDDARSKVVKGNKQVQKLVNITHVYLNHNYTKKVQNLTGDSSFVAYEMKGKTRISSTLLQADKTKELMIDGKVLKSQTVHNLAYFHNGEEITEKQGEELNLWTPSYYKHIEKQTMGRGSVDVEDDFNIINTYLSRIVKIKIQGIEYTIIKG